VNAILLIARRELAAYLRTMSGYVIIACVLLLDGLFFTAYALKSNSTPSAEVLSSFFFISSGFTITCSVFLSMRLLAEERQTGTIQLLYSSPVTDAEIVVGKYLSALGFLAVFLLASFYMPAIVMVYGKVSFGHLLAGYFGLLLVGSMSLAVGTFGSSLTSSQVLAAILSGVMVVALTVAWLMAMVTDRPLTDAVQSLAWYSHFKPFQDGLVQLKHVAYFALVTYVALFAATRVLESRRWR